MTRRGSALREAQESEDLVQETLGRMYLLCRRSSWSGAVRIDNPAAYAHTVLVRSVLGLSEWNAVVDKAATRTRPDPPLTVAELKAIATDPSWQKIIDVMGPRPVITPATATAKK